MKNLSYYRISLCTILLIIITASGCNNVLENPNAKSKQFYDYQKQGIEYWDKASAEYKNATEYWKNDNLNLAHSKFTVASEHLQKSYQYFSQMNNYYSNDKEKQLVDYSLKAVEYFQKAILSYKQAIELYQDYELIPSMIQLLVSQGQATGDIIHAYNEYHRLLALGDEYTALSSEYITKANEIVSSLKNS